MLSWLWSLFGKKRNRAVFRYWNGTRRIAADPLRLRDGLTKAFPAWATAAEELVTINRADSALAKAALDIGPKLAAERDKKRERLVSDLVNAVRAAFGVRDFGLDGLGREVGLTDWECIDLLAEYLAWVTDLMEETRPLPMPPAPTGLVPAEASAPASASALPSTPPESAASVPTSSPEPSAAPSTKSDPAVTTELPSV